MGTTPGFLLNNQITKTAKTIKLNTITSFDSGTIMSKFVFGAVGAV